MLDFDTALTNWLKAVMDDVFEPQVNKHWREKHNVPNCYTLDVERGSKYVRIVSKSSGSACVWAFVALQDGHTKQMGNYKRGDIFKPASYKMPAKHARGNIFDLSKGPTCNVVSWTGPEYLK